MIRRPRIDTLIALALWIAIGAGAFQTFYLRIYALDSTRLGAYWTEQPYRAAPGLRRLLIEADRRVPDGARIAVWSPHGTWDRGYSYVLNRAQYVLIRKRVLPLVDPNDRPLPQNLAAAEYVACWTRCIPPPGFRPIWESEQASLLRRGR